MQYLFLSSRSNLTLVHRFEPIMSRCFLSQCYYKCPPSISPSLRWLDSLRKRTKHGNGHTKQQRMWLNWLLIVFLNTNHLVDSLSFEPDDIDSEEEWDSMESLTLSADDYDTDGFLQQFKAGAESVTKRPPPLKLPESVQIPASQLYKDLFKPEKGSGPVPPLVRSILLPPAAAPKAATAGSASTTVEVLCYLDRVNVRVLKSFFSNPSAHKNLKLGTCAVNKFTATHYYFLYSLTGCGIKRGEDANRITYSNALYYKPVVTGLIVRELPFTIPIQCIYTKFRRSYQVGYLPKIAGGTVFKSLQTQAEPTITAMDASWKLLATGQSFVLGQPVCFEAKGQSSDTRKRLYLNRCFVTSPNPQPTDKYSVVENYGCLVDSENSALTKFYTTVNKMTVRLCVAAFLFKNMVSLPQSTKTMFMHCELEFGPETPTPSAKSCTYNAKTKKWTELYGDASVCNCCATTCPAPPVASGKTMITSKSWDLKSALETVESIPKFSVDGHDDFELLWEWDDY